MEPCSCQSDSCLHDDWEEQIIPFRGGAFQRGMDEIMAYRAKEKAASTLRKAAAAEAERLWTEHGTVSK